MSNFANTELLEIAAELIDYWTGTMWAAILEDDIEHGDLEALHEHVKEATQEMANQEGIGTWDF